MADDDPLDFLEAHIEAKKERETKELAGMFVQPSICRYCGSQVALPDVHKAFHDALKERFDQIAANFDSIVKGMQR